MPNSIQADFQQNAAESITQRMGRKAVRAVRNYGHRVVAGGLATIIAMQAVTGFGAPAAPVQDTTIPEGPGVGVKQQASFGEEALAAVARGAGTILTLGDAEAKAGTEIGVGSESQRDAVAGGIAKGAGTVVKTVLSPLDVIFHPINQAARAAKDALDGKKAQPSERQRVSRNAANLPEAFKNTDIGGGRGLTDVTKTADGSFIVGYNDLFDDHPMNISRLVQRDGTSILNITQLEKSGQGRQLQVVYDPSGNVMVCKVIKDGKSVSFKPEAVKPVIEAFNGASVAVYEGVLAEGRKNGYLPAPAGTAAPTGRPGAAQGQQVRQARPLGHGMGGGQ